MSPICDIFLIGSQAAKVGGFLPAWREGKTHDIDLVTDEASARSIAAMFGQPFVPHVAGGLCISHPARFDIDFAVLPDRWALLDRLCPPPISMTVAGQPLWLRVAPIEVVWAIRAFTIGLSPGTLAKGVRDAVWYDAQPKSLTDDHMRLAHLYRQIGMDAAIARLCAGRGDGD